LHNIFDLLGPQCHGYRAILSSPYLAAAANQTWGQGDSFFVMTTKTTIEVRNDIADLDRLNGFMAAFWQSNHLPEDEIFLDVTLALEEVFANVVQHAFHEKSARQVHVELELHHEDVHLTVEDDGNPFNPLDAPEVDVTVPLTERSIGGLGIFLVRRLMDRIEYSRAKDKNRLTMKKRVFKKTQ
jgi:serine/threonine-protein kinase RsbW